VLLFGFVDVGSLGPLPDIYDPSWSTDKAISLVVEGLAALGALGLLVLPPVASRSGGQAMDG